MYYFYNLLLYCVLIILLPVIAVWFLLAPKHAAGFWQKFTGRVEFNKLAGKSRRLVFHAVSVGELMAARPLIEWLNSQDDTQVVITSTTQTGYDLAEKQFPHNQHYFLPYDLPHAVEFFMQSLNPTHVLVMETELWPNLSWYCTVHDIPLILINGRLSERSFKRYRYLSFLMRSVLSSFTALFVQTPEDAERLIQLGAEKTNVQVLGNLKFASLPQAENAHLKSITQRLKQAWGDSPVILIASTHEGEDELLLSTYKQLLAMYPDLKLIIAPRHPERFEQVYELMQKIIPSCVTRRSDMNDAIDVMQAVLIDSIGELPAFYKLATLVVMAGSFVWQGGHNILEPMAYGVPVITGPNMKNFRAVTTLASQFGAVIQLESILLPQIVTCLDDLLSHPRKVEMLQQGVKLLLQHQADVFPKYTLALEQELFVSR